MRKVNRKPVIVLLALSAVAFYLAYNPPSWLVGSTEFEQGICMHPALNGGMPTRLAEDEKVNANGDIVVTTPDGRTLRVTGAACLLYSKE